MGSNPTLSASFVFDCDALTQRHRRAHASPDDQADDQRVRVLCRQLSPRNIASRVRAASFWRVAVTWLYRSKGPLFKFPSLRYAFRGRGEPSTEAPRMERWVRRYWGYPIVVLLLLSWVAFIGGKIPRLTAVVFVLLFSLGDAYYSCSGSPCGATR